MAGELHVTDPGQPSIVGHYIQPPFSVLDRRAKRWQQRTRWWRDRLPDDAATRTDPANPSSGLLAIGDGVSRFDPTIAEIFYRWWTRPGDLVVDPFAGGPTRGLVATAMGRDYHGLDVRPEQVAENCRVGGLWTYGDARTAQLPECDAILTCPPYYDLEQYSTDPRDLSVMSWPDYQTAYRDVIVRSVQALRRDRYIGIVISDVRDRTGAYRGLPTLTWQALTDAGVSVVADLPVIDPVGSKYLTGWRLLGQTRKPTRTHQYLIVGCTGDLHTAADRLRSVDMHTTPDGDVDV